MMKLAQECKNLDVHCHVSTCYVNCTRKGRVEEEVYEPDVDVSKIVSHIMSLSKQEVDEQEMKLIGKFPNTYTYTKNLAEKMLM